jgi:hypothetical protein
MNDVKSKSQNHKTPNVTKLHIKDLLKNGRLLEQIEKDIKQKLELIYKNRLSGKKQIKIKTSLKNKTYYIHFSLICQRKAVVQSVKIPLNTNIVEDICKEANRQLKLNQ